MRPLLIALLCIVACLVCALPAEAAPVRDALHWLAGKGKQVISAPLHIRQNRKEVRQSRRAARGC